MKRTPFIQRILFILNILALIAICLSYLSMFVSPEYFWMLAFMGLAHPILLIINLIFVVYWLFVRKKTALFSLFIILIGWGKIGDVYQISNKSNYENIPKDSLLEVMSYNVRLFDLYNWTENKNTRNNILELIRKQQSDIICFQEFFHEDTGIFNTLDTLKQIQEAKNVHIDYSAHVKNVNHWGIATFTRFPIIEKGLIHFKDSSDNISIFTDVLFHKDTVRIYNLHLESIRFRRADYEALEKITGKRDETNLDGPQRIISRMRRAYIRRARQTNVIREHIEASPHPVIVCGDFNDTPTSYAYHQIAKNLDDSYREKGNGIGSTYVGMIPFLRIDYVLFDPIYFEVLDSKIIKKKYSDHYPVVSTLKLNAAAEKIIN
jgi:endonuclease/exonuclease/phosphatase family metal-dependent hydrolase